MNKYIKHDLRRFENEIKRLESYPVFQDQVMQYGSSFFANWGYENVKSLLAEENILILNHGFGGAVADELLYYYDRLVRPYRPRVMLIRAGINDATSGYTGEEAFSLLARLCEWSSADCPGIKIGLLPVFDIPMLSRQTEEVVKRVEEFNLLCYKYAAEKEQVFALDLSEFVYKTPQDIGTLRNFKDIFLEDGLHLTEAGYSMVAHVIKEKLIDALNGEI